MNTIRTPAWLLASLAFGAILSVSACSGGQRDIDGKAYELSEPIPIAAHESLFNTYALIKDVKAHSIKRRTRDNGRSYVEEKRVGSLTFELFYAPRRWFSDNSRTAYTSIESLRQSTSTGEAFTATPLSVTDDGAGGVHFRNGDCHRLSFVKRLESEEPRPGKPGAYNMAGWLVLCGRDDFDANGFVKDFALISEDERAAIRARLSE